MCAAPALALPDGRAYEQVTPANKDQGDPYLRAGIFADFQSSVDGNGFSYPSLYGFPGAQSYGLSYMSARAASGWSSENVVPPQSPTTGGLCPAFSGMVGYSSDMSKAALVDGANQAGGCGTDDPQLVPGEPQGAQNLFVVNRANNSYQLVNVTPAGVTPADAAFQGGSSDLSHVVFTETAQLTANAPSASLDLYEWSGGTVSLVSILPGNTAAVGTIAGGPMGNALHAVSADGSRVYFVANNNLYLRQNGTSTVQVDAAASGAPGPGGSGQFVGASSDGSKVFFTDDAGNGLTSNTVAGSGSNLYEYNVGIASLTDLTPAGDVEVQGGVEVSGDGSDVYFVANGSLAAGATAAQPNLYVNDNGTTKFIATLNASDSCDWTPGCLMARLSSNGQFLVFNSINSLTGFDNTDATTASPDTEIFRYDSAAPALVCVTCSPSGAAPTGNTGVNAPELSGIPSNIDTLQRYVSDSGQVFFDTPNALVASDSNGVRDVYEYEAGQPQLISSGTNATDSLYLDNSPDGNNAFFVTVERLVPQDIDGAYDIYDARVAGGFPVSPTPPPCQGDACKPTIKAPPAPTTVASITFVGPGNPTPGTTGGEVKLLKRSVKGTSIKLRVKVPSAGQFAVTGHGLHKALRQVDHRGSFSVTMHLTKRAKNTLKHKHKMKLTITVRYVPASGPASTAQVKLTVKA
jgi:hypothetical protein